MAKGYPGRKRARKAYWLGVESIRRGRPRHNPYTNPRLHDLFERGRKDGPGPLKPGMQPPPERAARPERPAGGFGGGGFGGGGGGFGRPRPGPGRGGPGRPGRGPGPGRY